MGWGASGFVWSGLVPKSTPSGLFCMAAGVSGPMRKPLLTGIIHWHMKFWLDRTPLTVQGMNKIGISVLEYGLDYCSMAFLLQPRYGTCLMYDLFSGKNGKFSI